MLRSNVERVGARACASNSRRSSRAMRCDCLVASVAQPRSAACSLRRVASARERGGAGERRGERQDDAQKADACGALLHRGREESARPRRGGVGRGGEGGGGGGGGGVGGAGGGGGCAVARCGHRRRCSGVDEALHAVHHVLMLRHWMVVLDRTSQNKDLSVWNKVRNKAVNNAQQGARTVGGQHRGDGDAAQRLALPRVEAFQQAGGCDRAPPNRRVVRLQHRDVRVRDGQLARRVDLERVGQPLDGWVGGSEEMQTAQSRVKQRSKPRDARRAGCSASWMRAASTRASRSVASSPAHVASRAPSPSRKRHAQCATVHACLGWKMGT